jgi:hypothetical protein
VPVIFDAEVTGEPTDRFQPFVASCRGCRWSSPIDRGLRADEGFVPLGGKASEAAQQIFGVCHLKARGTAQGEVGGHGVLHGSTCGHGCAISFNKLTSALA